ncbi:MAG: ABC transporter permease [Candidatus Methylomirabilia bacterium]
MRLPTRHEIYPVLGFLLLFQVVSAEPPSLPFLTLPPFIAPGLYAILKALRDIMATEYMHFLRTLIRIVEGLTLAFVVGVTWGIVTAFSERIERSSTTLIKLIIGVPGLCWVLIAVIWFGNIEFRILFVILITSFPFYAMNVLDGIKGVPRDYVEMVKSFRPGKMQLVRILIIPFVTPHVLTTTKVVLGYATRIVIIAELVGAAVGVGAQLQLAQEFFEIEFIYAWTILLVVFVLILEALIETSESHLLKWRPKELL